MAAISEDSVKITNHLWSADTAVMTDCLRELGIKIIHCKDYLQVIGNIEDVRNGKYELDARLSGTTMRFLLALCCIIPGVKILKGEAGLNARPVKDLVDALVSLGAEISYLEKDGYPPLQIKSSSLQGNKTEISGDISSQFLSGVLMIAPRLQGLNIDVHGNQVSKSYIDMTTKLMSDWGVKVVNDDYKHYEISKHQKYHMTEYVVEGDFSAGSYFAAMAVLGKSELVLKNLDKNSSQGDKQLFEILRKMGNVIEFGDNECRVKGSGICPVDVNMQLCPDQAQTLAVLAAFAKGPTFLRGVRSLRVKETERVKALQNELLKMGIKTESPDNDTLVIFGGEPHGAEIDTYGDHRMAMSFAVAGVKLKGMKINEPQVVNKTFPDFWEKMESVGVKIVS